MDEIIDRKEKEDMKLDAEAKATSEIDSESDINQQKYSD